ncbi:MAG: YbhB/YbcL family Raf kinase inhibitor-like protein [Synergistetes bacterium]|nr:YbhB/YbcL family Raf kinase inhibitor-like protein [Synergistota bacterium]
MKIESKAFREGGLIPKIHTCDGKDISPQLTWSDAPDGTESFALICDDPDAPAGVWVHWVIYNIPKNMKELKQNIPKKETLPDGTKQGKNDFGKIGYGGPCPPHGRPHRYFFKLYALDTLLNARAGITKQELLQLIEGHILSTAETYGKYGR